MTQIRTEPDKWISLRGGQDVDVLTARGEKRTIRIGEVPGRLAIDLLMAAGNEDPQTVVAIAAGMAPEDIDWIATSELRRLQTIAIDINFEGCAEMARSRMKAAERMMPLLREAGKKAIEQASEVLVKEWESSLKSKLPSLRSITEQLQSSIETPPNSSAPTPFPGSTTCSNTEQSGNSKGPTSSPQDLAARKGSTPEPEQSGSGASQGSQSKSSKPTPPTSTPSTPSSPSAGSTGNHP